jgi:hypothetical protein
MMRTINTNLRKLWHVKQNVYVITANGCEIQTEIFLYVTQSPAHCQLEKCSKNATQGTETHFISTSLEQITSPSYPITVKYMAVKIPKVLFTKTNFNEPSLGVII